MSHPGNDAVIEQIRDEVAEMSQDEKVDMVYAHLVGDQPVHKRDLYFQMALYSPSDEGFVDETVAEILIEALPDGGDE